MAKKSTVYIQHADFELNMDDVINAAKDAWGGKRGDIKDFTLYVKPEEKAAYYVINGTDTGKVEL
ncbi:MAG: hypothetical protein E7269_05540 [Lachnospiraceae bacterium]|nr:hypothetical protein [Lachnospiraceae bacterium]